MADEQAAMRIELTVDDELLKTARELTGMTYHSALVRDALQSLVRGESARQFATLGGKDPEASAPRC